MHKQEMEQIYEENVAVVYKYLFCVTQDVYLAEELTQETFYQAIKGIHNFRGDCKISVRLCQIGKRLREVMYLRLTGELSFAEIGEIMGVTENWARVTFYRGKQKILKGEHS